MSLGASAPLPRRTILVVDDQAESLDALARLLRTEGHAVLTAVSGAEALLRLAEGPDLVILDDFMPEMSVEALVRALRDEHPLLPIIVQTRCAAERPPRELLRRLPIQGCHDKNDGAERLLLWLDTLFTVHDRLAQVAAAERLKTELLANVSHEFRTPLNIIVGYAELIRDGTFGACPPDALAVVEKIVGSAGYLLELVGEFLDLSKIEGEASALHDDRIVLAPLFDEIAEPFSVLLRDRPVVLSVAVPSGLPPVRAEGAKLRVVIQNLLSNALKFTERGEIALSAERIADDRVAIRVRDTGPGIPPEHQEAIFDLFHQVSPQQAAGKGIGLGLALARRFARVLGGDLTVESTLGAGSTFTVVVPAAPAEPLRLGGTAA